MTLLARRYAAALYALAAEQQAVDALGADLQALHAAFAEPGARALIASPDVTAVERARALDKVCAGRHPLLRSMVGVLQQRHRLAVLLDLYPAWRALVMQARGELEGLAESAHPLGADELAALTELAGRLSGRKVRLSAAVRPELLGGVRLRLGNVLYDGSLRNGLEQLERHLAQATV